MTTQREKRSVQILFHWASLFPNISFLKDSPSLNTLHISSLASLTSYIVLTPVIGSTEEDISTWISKTLSIKATQFLSLTPAQATTISSIILPANIKNKNRITILFVLRLLLVLSVRGPAKTKCIPIIQQKLDPSGQKILQKIIKSFNKVLNSMKTTPRPSPHKTQSQASEPLKLPLSISTRSAKPTPQPKPQNGNVQNPLPSSTIQPGKNDSKTQKETLAERKQLEPERAMPRKPETKPKPEPKPTLKHSELVSVNNDSNSQAPSSQFDDDLSFDENLNIGPPTPSKRSKITKIEIPSSPSAFNSLKNSELFDDNDDGDNTKTPLAELNDSFSDLSFTDDITSTLQLMSAASKPRSSRLSLAPTGFGRRTTFSRIPSKPISSIHHSLQQKQSQKPNQFLDPTKILASERHPRSPIDPARRSFPSMVEDNPPQLDDKGSKNKTNSRKSRDSLSLLAAMGSSFDSSGSSEPLPSLVDAGSQLQFRNSLDSNSSHPSHSSLMSTCKQLEMEISTLRDAKSKNSDYITTLKDSLASSKSTNERLLAEKNGLTQMNKSLEQQYKSVTTSLANLEAQISSSSQQLGGVSIENIQQQLKSTEQRSEQFQATISEQTNHIKVLQQENKTLNSDLIQSKNRIGSLNSKLNILEASENTSKSRSAQVSQLQEQLISLGSDKEHLQNQLGKVQDVLNQEKVASKKLASDLETSAKQILSLQDEKNVKTNIISTIYTLVSHLCSNEPLSIRLASYDKTLDECGVSINTEPFTKFIQILYNKDEIDAEVSNLQSRNKQLVADAANHSITSSSVSKLEQDISNNQTLYQQASNTIVELEQKNNLLQSSVEKWKNLHSNAVAKSQSLSTVRDEYKSLKNEKMTLQTQLDDKIIQITKLQGTITKLNSDIFSFQSQITQLKASYSKQQDTATNDFSQKIKTLENDISTLKRESSKEIQNLQAIKSDLERRLNAETLRTATLEEQKNLLQTDFKRVNTESLASLKSVTSLENDLRHANNKVFQLSSANETLNSQILTNELEINRTHNSVDSLKQQNKTLKESLNISQQNLIKAKKQVQDLTTDFKKQISQLQATYKAAENSKKHLTNQLTELSKSDSNSEALQVAQQSLDRANAEIKKLYKKLARIKASHAREHKTIAATFYIQATALANLENKTKMRSDPLSGSSLLARNRYSNT